MSEEDLEKVLTRARRLLADISATLQLESDQLFSEQFDGTDEDRLAALKTQISQIQKAWDRVIDLEAKTGVTLVAKHPQLDLEAARGSAGCERFGELSGRGFAATTLLPTRRWRAGPVADRERRD